MKIDINKQYETTCGKAVRIITTEANNLDYPIICEVLQYTDSWCLQYNESNGSTGDLFDGYEIIEVQ